MPSLSDTTPVLWSSVALVKQCNPWDRHAPGMFPFPADRRGFSEFKCALMRSGDPKSANLSDFKSSPELDRPPIRPEKTRPIQHE